MKGKVIFRFLSVVCSAAILTSTFGMNLLNADGAASDDEKLMTYNAVEMIKEAEKQKKLPADSIWSYSEKSVQKNAETNFYELTGSWVSRDLNLGGGWCSSAQAIRTALPNMVYKWDADPGEGFAVYQNQVVTYVGTSAKHSPALTFTAPKSGTVHLYDPSNGSIGACKPDDTFWTLDVEGEIIDVAIYKNDQKIWPMDSDYYELTHTNQSVAFPDLQDISVAEGDRLRIQFVPVNHSWGYCGLAPQVDYVSYEQKTPSYSAYSSVMDSQEQGKIEDDSPWTFTAKRVEKNIESGLYLPTGEWFTPVVATGKSDSVGVNDYFENKQLLVPQKNNGLAAKNGKVITYAGYGFNGYAGALTFHAPYSGTINLLDPSGIGIGSAGKSNPFWTLHEKAKQVGVAIYKNDEKIWPVEEDYFVLKGDLWENGKKISGNTQMALPDIGDLTVTKGDDIRIALIPLSLDWGYIALAPRVDYTQVDAQQPQDGELPVYKAYDAMSEAVEAKSLEGSAWQIDGMPCYPDQDGYNSPSGKWISLSLGEGKTTDSSINKAVPSWLMYHDSSIGTSVYNNSVLLSAGSVGVDFAVSLTFVAPKTGNVKLSDPTGSMIGSAGIAGPFWSLNESNKIAGIAIYKNDEKIWPADSDYYRLQGKWDVDTHAYVNNQDQISFPTLNDIPLNAGDRLRICVIPVKNTWLYVKMSPRVEYQTINQASEPPKPADEKKPAAVYDAVSEVKKAMDAGDLSNCDWKIQAVKYTPSNFVDGEPELAELFNENLPTIYKPMTFSSTLFPYTWFNVAQTSIAFTVTRTDRLMIPVGGITANGYRVWPAITFNAPQTGELHLYAKDMSAGISAMSQGNPYYTLKKTFDPDEGDRIPIVIYRNSTKIWPTDDSQDNVLTVQKRTIPFPDMTFQVYKDDSIRIIVPTGGWAFLTMSPVAEYLSLNDLARPENDSPTWDYGSKESGSVGWDDLPKLNQPIRETGSFVQNQTTEDAPSQVTDTPKTVKKTIVKKLYKKAGSHNNTSFVIIIVIAGAVILAASGTAIIIIRKRILQKKKDNHSAD